MRHTQGEWKVIGEEYGGEESRIAIGIECEDAGDGGPEFVTVAEVIGREDDEMSDDELWANVNLIKAAPVMLQGLKELHLRTKQFIAGDLVTFPAALLPQVEAIIAAVEGKAVQHDA